jgi:hypothetical protein
VQELKDMLKVAKQKEKAKEDVRESPFYAACSFKA